MSKLAAAVTTINLGRRITEARIAARTFGRCEIIVPTTGAGCKGAHRCTFRALAKFRGKAVCGTHLRFLRAKP